MKHTVDFFKSQIEEKGKLDEDELSLLFLIPLVQVAWAHGAISPREALCIFEAAREDGLDPTHWFNEKLDSFLIYQPSTKFFEDCLALMKQSLAAMSVRERKELTNRLLGRCEKVAAAAGDKSLMDVDHRITADERRLLDELNAFFGLPNEPGRKKRVPRRGGVNAPVR